MKKIITSLCLGLMFVVGAFSESKAANVVGGTYYVVSGESFSLTPSVTSLFQYKWLLDPGAGQVETLLGSATGGVFTKVFGDSTATSPVIHKLTLGVLSEVGGCLSDVIEHTIIVLPKIKVTIAADKENFCLGTPVSANLTATVTAVTGLGTYGVTLSPVKWVNGSTDAGTGNAIAVTSSGTYKALVEYILPTGVGTPFLPTAFKLANAVTGITKTINNNLPLPVLPTITLN